MPLYPTLVRHKSADECSWKVCKVPGEFQRDFCREWRIELFVLQGENKMNTSDTFTKPTTF